MVENDILDELNKDLYRKNLIRYTCEAFSKIPIIDNPYILDIGCGSGIPALELARLSRGRIFALDINQYLLDKFRKKVEDSGLSNRIKIQETSLFDINFPDETFDIIWSEGSIYIIGFERGIKEWRHFLKPEGFLVVHDEVQNRNKKTDLIESYGYKLFDYFILSEIIWWEEYFSHLEKCIKQLSRKYNNNTKVQEILNNEKKEINNFKNNPGLYRSIYFIMQKKKL